MKEDGNSDCRFTTMFDYYALPGNFPEMGKSAKISNVYEKINDLESAFGNDIADRRFLPYLQLHEFEALVFADPGKLGGFYFEDRDSKKIRRLCELLEKYNGNPEQINDGPETAPSIRILQEFKNYDKANLGPDIAASIGLDTLRIKCRHFSEWLEKLENLSTRPPG